ncbi:hypothetical protein ACIQFP_19810 [Nocardiopsis alba]|uniref:hypothetical protein n=1 Tax=Nocardiopsis alba TaxID=53437 RepID=UPI00381BDA00
MAQPFSSKTSASKNRKSTSGTISLSTTTRLCANGAYEYRIALQAPDLISSERKEIKLSTKAEMPGLSVLEGYKGQYWSVRPKPVLSAK